MDNLFLGLRRFLKSYDIRSAYVSTNHNQDALSYVLRNMRRRNCRQTEIFLSRPGNRHFFRFLGQCLANRLLY